MAMQHSQVLRNRIHQTPPQQRRPPSSQSVVVRNLWHAQGLHVGDYPTELWGLQATRRAPAHDEQLTVVIVPGNPGCSGFYRKLMQQLHVAFDGAADILAVSHVGHDAANSTQGALWGLDCQIRHKAQLLQQLRGPTVVLGHSIGSYITLQALQQLRAAGGATGGLQNIAKVFLLMPFLATHWDSWEQRVLAAAARHHGPALSAAAGWVQGSPRWLQDRVLQLMCPGAEPHAAESLRAALNLHGCANNWHMAEQEFSVLDAPVDWGPIQQLGDKAAVVYNPSDPWFQQHDAMRQHVPHIEAHAHDGLSHAFCLSADECAVVAQLVRESVMQQGAAADAPHSQLPGGQSQRGVHAAPAAAQQAASTC